MHFLLLIIPLSVIAVSCGIQQINTYYAIDEDDLVFVKPKALDLTRYSASVSDLDFESSDQTQSAIISIEHSSSTDLFSDIYNLSLRDPGVLVETTDISGFSQMKNDIREKHIAVEESSGALLLFAIRARNSELYYLRTPGADNFGVEILPNALNDLDDAGFTGNYNIEKCTHSSDCLTVGTYRLDIAKQQRDTEVKTSIGIFDTFRLDSIHQIGINDENYNISYRIEEIGFVNPPIGKVKFFLEYNDNLDIENIPVSIAASVTQIDLPKIVDEE